MGFVIDLKTYAYPLELIKEERRCQGIGKRLIDFLEEMEAKTNLLNFFRHRAVLHHISYH